MSTVERTVISCFIGVAAVALTSALGYGFWPGLWLGLLLNVVLIAVTWDKP